MSHIFHDLLTSYCFPPYFKFALFFIYCRCISRANCWNSNSYHGNLLLLYRLFQWTTIIKIKAEITIISFNWSILSSSWYMITIAHFVSNQSPIVSCLKECHNMHRQTMSRCSNMTYSLLKGNVSCLSLHCLNISIQQHYDKATTFKY
jgi:hypothetical protein